MPMKNIVLIGMPGAGKSTVGVILAKTLGMTFVDTDIAIQEQAWLLQEIIDSEGPDAFLATEEGTVLSIHCRNSVIATGGSVVFSRKAMDHLKKAGVVVYPGDLLRRDDPQAQKHHDPGDCPCCGPESFRYVLRKGPAGREVRRYHGRLRRGGFRGSRGEGDRGDCRGFLEDASTGAFASQPAQPCRIEFYKKMCFCRKPVFKLVQPPLRATCPPNGRGAHAMLLYYLCRGAYLSTRNTEHCRNRGMPQACGREGKKCRRPKRAIIQSVHGFLQSKKMEMCTGMEAEDLFLGAH